MIVDDNEYMIRVLRTVLTSMHISMIRTCATAPAAFSELRAWSPDLIFVDLATQKVSGLRLIRAIRRKENPARHCPIVLCTAYTDAAIVRRARDAGADYTLAKPFSVLSMHRLMLALRAGKREFIEIGHYYGPDRRRRMCTFEGQDRRARIEAMAAASAG